MGLKRKRIREEITQRLRDEVTLVNPISIYESRVEPIFDLTSLPAIAVYTREESNEDFNDHHKVQQRELSLAIEVLVRGNENSDDALDEICDEVEKSLSKRESERSSNYQRIELQSTEIGFLAEGRVPKAAARLTYLVQYEIDKGE